MLILLSLLFLTSAFTLLSESAVGKVGVPLFSTTMFLEFGKQREDERKKERKKERKNKGKREREKKRKKERKNE